MVGGTEFGKNPIKKLELPRGAVQVQPAQWRERGKDTQNVNDGALPTGTGDGVLLQADLGARVSWSPRSRAQKWLPRQTHSPLWSFCKAIPT